MRTTHNKGFSLALLQDAGVRPTRQRCALAEYLFSGPHRHVTAESVYAATSRKAVKLSLATVYNNLHHFVEMGLLNRVTLDQDRLYFDTNMDPHHHLYNEDTGELTDIPLCMVCLPSRHRIPPKHNVKKIDVIVRLTKGPVSDDSPWPSCSLKNKRITV